MKKWRLIQVSMANSPTSTNGRVDMFPSDLVEIDWLFQKFPKAKKSIVSAGKYLGIETHSHLVGDIVDAIWAYLGDNGWEYCGDNRFKRAFGEGN